MPLQIRTFECDGCGVSIDRDWNAAINLKNITFGTKENYACGDTSVGDLAYDKSRYVSKKQENVEVLIFG
jgi:transposase